MTAVVFSAINRSKLVGLSQILAANLRRFLAMKGMTGRDFAERLGEKESTVSRWLTGKREPRLDKIAEMAKVLGCSVPDLLSEEGKDDFERMAQFEREIRLIVAKEIAASAETVSRRRSPKKQ